MAVHLQLFTLIVHQKPRRVVAVALLTILTALVAGCEAGSGEGLNSNGRPLTEGGADGPLIAEFKSIQDNIFTPLCVTCHSGGAAPQGLRLDAVASYASLVGIDSTEVPGILRVAPGNPDASYLVQKLEGTAQQGEQMPLGGPPLPQADIDIVRQWIADGALPASDPPAGVLPVVVSILPADGSSVTDAPTSVTVVFSVDMEPSLFGPATFLLERSGGDGDFAGGNEIMLVASAIAPDPANPRVATLSVDAGNVELVADDYRVTLVGSGATALAGADGTVLDGDSDGVEGGDFVATFSFAPIRATLQSLQASVFTPSCALSGCHTAPDPQASLNLSSVDLSFVNLVDVDSVEVPSLKRVQPSNSADSYLLQKVLGTAAVGDRMPRGGPPLSEELTSAIAEWIDQGALFDDAGGVPDTTAPVVTVTPVASPLADMQVLSAAAVDDVAVVEVTYRVDGAAIGSSEAAPYAVVWDTTLLADGDYVLDAQARDAAGNVGTSPSLTVTKGAGVPVDVMPPSVSLAPLPAAVSGVVRITAAASDDTGVERVDFRIDGELLASDTAAPYFADWNADAASLGAHSIVAEAFDAAANTAASTPVSVTVVDNDSPDVSLTSPVATTVSGSVLVSASATDNREVAEVRFFVDGMLLGAPALAPYELVWDSTTVMDGMHSIAVEATDSSGNVGLAPVRQVTVNNAPPADTEPPVVSLDLPVAGTVSGTVTLLAQATDNTGVTEVRFRANGTLIAAVATAPYTADWNSASVADGAYSITAEALDLAGNSAITAGVALTVDNTAPAVVSQLPAAGSTLNTFPTQISVTFSEAMLASGFTTATVMLTASGGDDTFGDGNEIALSPLGLSVTGDQLVVDLGSTPPVEDTLQLTITGAVTDLNGVALDGNGDGSPGDAYAATLEVDGLVASLASIQARVFSVSCASSSCHDGEGNGGGLPAVQDLSTAQTSFDSLVGVESLEVPGTLRVDPGNPDDSYLIHKLEGTQAVGNPMPLGAPPLSQADIDVIRLWISNGAAP